MNRERYKKLVILISVLLITSLLFILANTPLAGGYEISIYRVFPWYFWGLVTFSYLWGIFIILDEIFRKRKLEWYFLSVPILTMLFTLSILLLMPVIRGYAAFGRGDTLTHIGLIKDILYRGNFGGLWYPIAHISGAIFSEVSGINPKTVTMIYPFIFFLSYILGIFYFVEEFFDKRIALIPSIICLIPLHRYYTFKPHTLVIFMLPFALYLFVKSMRDKRFFYLSFFFLIPFIIFHPLRSLIFIGTLSFLILFFIIIKMKDMNLIYDIKKGLAFTLHSLFIFIIWYGIYHGEPIRRMIRGYLGDVYTPGADRYANIMAEYSTPLDYIFRQVTFDYGILAILSLLSLSLITIYIKIYLNNKLPFLKKYMPLKIIEYIPRKKIKYLSVEKINDKHLLKYGWKNILFMSLFVLFAILLLVFFLGGVPGGYGRHLFYAIVFSTFLVGFLFFITKTDFRSIFENKKIDKNKILCSFLIFLIILSIMSFYPSPTRITQNVQVTQMELSGMGWTFDNMNNTLLIEELIGTSQHRFSHVIFRRHIRSEFDHTRHKQGEVVAPYFGYRDNDTLGIQYETDKYLVISELNRIRYQELYPGWEEARLLTEEDFEKLEEDRTVNKIYSNGEFDSYYIVSEG